MIENWKPVVGYEGIYEVSDLGRVRVVKDGQSGPLKAQRTDRQGYARVDLYRSGARKNVQVHRLVALAFLVRAEGDTEVRHLDGDSSHNELGNLRWGTASDNRRDSVVHGTHTMATRTTCPRGHLLEAPNIAAWAVRKGIRKCLACSRARSAVQRDPALDLQATADVHYAQIVGEVAR